MKSPSYKNLRPASPKASAAASGSSKKSGTSPELLLRRTLWRVGCRYRRNCKNLPGNPDLVFVGPRVVIFCDGDFWHGKDWITRRAKLEKGHNAPYWVAKIERNIERDEKHTRALMERGWTVLRFWEFDIKNDISAVVAEVMQALGKDMTVSPKSSLSGNQFRASMETGRQVVSAENKAEDFDEPSPQPKQI